MTGLPALDLPTWLEYVLVIGSIASATLALTALAGKTTKGARWLQGLINRPVKDDLAEVRAQLGRIEAKVTPSDGGSLLSRTEELAEGLSEVDGKVDRVAAEVHVLQETFEAHASTSEMDRADIRRKLREVRGET